MSSLLLTSLRSPFLDDAKVYPPLGILKLEAMVAKHTSQVEVDVVDEYDDKEFTTFEPYDFVGLSVMTPQREEAVKLLHGIKSRWPKKKVIIGGPHAKHYLKDVKKDPWDFIVPQDGERAIMRILSGVAERVDSDFMSKTDWANVPPIDRMKHRVFLSSYHYILEGKIATTILTATGCPERCHFCEDAKTAVRWTSLDNIRSELDQIVDLGYGGVYIFDDIFSLAQVKTKPIAEEFKKRGLIYRCNGQARYMNEDFMKMLADTGCREIAFGAETGSQVILDNIEKRTTVAMNYKFIELAAKYGIKVKAFILLGLPGENHITLQDTEKFIRWGMQNGMADFQCAIYYPYKGTQIRDAIDKGNNLVDLTFEGEGLGAYGQKGGNTECVVRTEALSREDLLTFRDYLVKTYRPKSHSEKWKKADFFDSHIVSKVDYDE